MDARLAHAFQRLFIRIAVHHLQNKVAQQVSAYGLELRNARIQFLLRTPELPFHVAERAVKVLQLVALALLQVVSPRQIADWAVIANRSIHRQYTQKQRKKRHRMYSSYTSLQTYRWYCFFLCTNLSLIGA